MNQEVLVRVEGVSKKFCRDLKQSLWYGVKDMVGELNPFAKAEGEHYATEELRPGEFWANKGVSFEVRRGECLGLIGHNGAGKTTLLRMLNGLIKPDAGRIEMHGKVAALIALGAGFNPVLTGRENIYINGAVLGLSKKEVDRKFDEIVEFAEIKDFIDAPVQSYSSGMQIRLGFSVATALEPDVLILDEVLAVGDLRFRQKSMRRIREVMKTAAVIFVSHNTDLLRTICQSGVILEKGQMIGNGEINKCLNVYHTSRLAQQGSRDDVASDHPYYPIVCTQFSIQSERNEEVRENDPAVMVIEVEADEVIFNVHIAVAVCSMNSGARLSTIAMDRGKEGVSFPAGKSSFEVRVTDLALAAGPYRLQVYLTDADGVIISRSGTVGLFGCFTVKSRTKINHHQDFEEPLSLNTSFYFPFDGNEVNELKGASLES